MSADVGFLWLCCVPVVRSAGECTILVVYSCLSLASPTLPFKVMFHVRNVKGSTITTQVDCMLTGASGHYYLAKIWVNETLQIDTEMQQSKSQATKPVYNYVVVAVTHGYQPQILGSLIELHDDNLQLSTSLDSHFSPLSSGKA